MNGFPRLDQVLARSARRLKTRCNPTLDEAKKKVIERQTSSPKCPDYSETTPPAIDLPCARRLCITECFSQNMEDGSTTLGQGGHVKTWTEIPRRTSRFRNVNARKECSNGSGAPWIWKLGVLLIIYNAAKYLHDYTSSQKYVGSLSATGGL